MRCASLAVWCVAMCGCMTGMDRGCVREEEDVDNACVSADADKGGECGKAHMSLKPMVEIYRWQGDL